MRLRVLATSTRAAAHQRRTRRRHSPVGHAFLRVLRRPPWLRFRPWRCCSSCCPRAAATTRSPGGSGCRRRQCAITSPRCCSSCRFLTAPRPPQGTGGGSRTPTRAAPTATDRGRRARLRERYPTAARARALCTSHSFIDRVCRGRWLCLRSVGDAWLCLDAQVSVVVGAVAATVLARLGSPGTEVRRPRSPRRRSRAPCDDRCRIGLARSWVSLGREARSLRSRGGGALCGTGADLRVRDRFRRRLDPARPDGEDDAGE
jgi:hypothetical protein